ncbi:MAG TPA: C39 family peptidase [Candidatus Limnocylindria bacterium]|nr:C39 family peptidase [Candidatus Limnocylindria bacterium]
MGIKRLGPPFAALLAVSLVASFPQRARADDSGAALPPKADVGSMRHLWQSLNNCGPAAVVMALSTFGIDADQEEARIALRGPDVRRGMGPGGVGPWVASRYGLRSVSRLNGTIELMKHFVASGFAPMVTQWLHDPTISRIAHWRTVRGYDDDLAVFYVNDPMLGANVPLPYAWFDASWQPFSYRWMVIYRPDDAANVRQIVGPDWSEIGMRDRFYARAKTDAYARETSAAWLTYGEAAYQDGWFAEAVAAFERGMQLGSATGVFTVRSSYPRALRALGRETEANAAAASLADLTTTPSAVAASPDGFALFIAFVRAHQNDRDALTE